MNLSKPLRTHTNLFLTECLKHYSTTMQGVGFLSELNNIESVLKLPPYDKYGIVKIAVMQVMYLFARPLWENVIFMRLSITLQDNVKVVEEDNTQ